MAELMVDVITSLDGYGAADGWPGLWGMGGPEYVDFLAAQPGARLLMGANTYHLFADVLTRGEEGIGELTAAPKVVFSRRMTGEPAWENTTLVSTDAIEAVRALKAESDLPLRTIGSPTLCRSLLTAGLVDRYRVVVFPVVNGRTGRDRMYDGWPEVSLELVRSATFDHGLQLLEYVPTVLAGPPLEVTT